jgi:GNAT superfamily N-acetyltransferase
MHAAIRLQRCRTDEIAVVQHLAERIWRAHYPGIISDAQIDYMLARGYSAEALARFVDATDAGLTLALLDDTPVGFAAWYRTGTGPDEEVKLDKLYVLPEQHARGIGRTLIEHVEQEARAAGCQRVILNVNKHNAGSIAAYRRCGFTVRGPVVVDIGGGFVMDDFVMEKPVC